LALAGPVVAGLLTVGLYGCIFYFFHDAHHIFIYLLGDIASAGQVLSSA
jgi:hypothetical protein